MKVSYKDRVYLRRENAGLFDGDQRRGSAIDQEAVAWCLNQKASLESAAAPERVTGSEELNGHGLHEEVLRGLSGLTRTGIKLLRRTRRVKTTMALRRARKRGCRTAARRPLARRRTRVIRF